MASLYSRATPSQHRILRAVEGAIRNASHAHPEIQISPQHRRSIAKRAAGTLSGQWPEVLAASRTLSESGAASTARARRRASKCKKATGREGDQLRHPFPLRRLIAELARPLTAMKADGQHERVAAYVDVLKMIDALRRGQPTPAEKSAEIPSEASASALPPDEQNPPPQSEEGA